ncbi:hypothetical protein BGZ83_012058 [Gryganskiella cystojenkinii]|nr:hypothetical protein BGZ83_012058 [Gryganskiella cystojenkinii]
MTIEVEGSSTVPTAKTITGTSIDVPFMTTPEIFQDGVKTMDRRDLNSLDMKHLVSWARAIVHTERCRRKVEEQQATVKNSISTTNAAPVAVADKTTVVTDTAATGTMKSTATSTPTTNADALFSTLSTDIEGSTPVPIAKTMTGTSIEVPTMTTPETFQEGVKVMDRKDLNSLDMKLLLPWAKPIVNAERYRRKVEQQQQYQQQVVLKIPNPAGAVDGAATVGAKTKSKATATTSSTKAPTANVIAKVSSTPASLLSSKDAAGASSSSSPSSSMVKKPNPVVMTKETTPEQFKEKIMAMDRTDLNKTDIRTLPGWARALLDKERCRRKKMDTAPSNTSSVPATKMKVPVDKTVSSLSVSAATLTTAAMIAAQVEPILISSSLSASSPIKPIAGSASKGGVKVQEKEKVKVKANVPESKKPRAKVHDDSSSGNNNSNNIGINSGSIRNNGNHGSANNNGNNNGRQNDRNSGTNNTHHVRSSSSSAGDDGNSGRDSNNLNGNLNSGNNSNITNSNINNNTDASVPFRQQRETIDGHHLHKALVTASADKKRTSMYDCEIIYDASLQEEEFPYSHRYESLTKWKTRNIFGLFCCVNPKCRRTRGRDSSGWPSGKILVEFWYLYQPNAGSSSSLSESRKRGGSKPKKDRFRYRSQIHNQKCRVCNQYMEADLEESYIEKTLSAFELWAERREMMESNDDYIVTGPHDKERCHACQMGIVHANV